MGMARGWRTAGALVAAAVLAGLCGCGTTNVQKLPVTGKDKDLWNPPYPHGGMATGALRFGAPAKVATSVLPAGQAFTPAFVLGLPNDAIAFGNFEQRSSSAFELKAHPGPKILQAAGVLIGGGVKLADDHLRFLDWGELRESSVDLQTLSEAMVRGWFNQPGKALGNDALFQMRLDRSEFKQRPWVVTRSVLSTGLRYELTDKYASGFAIGASHAAAGSAGVGVACTAVDSRTLCVNEPMVVGYQLCYLSRIEPPLPGFMEIPENAAPMGRHKFVWRREPGGQEEEFEISLAELKRKDTRVRPEDSYPAPVMSSLQQKLQQGKPAAVAVVVEAISKDSLAQGGAWRRLNEGGIFRGDEAVRLRVVCQRPTYLYVVAKDGKGQTAVLYPKAPGEALAIGEDRAVPAGEWCFPKSVNGHDGLLYDPLEAQGTESFVVIAAEKQVADLPALLAGLTKSANAVATRDPTAGRGDWSFDLVSRNPVGFVKVENATAGDLPVPVFAGVGAATIVKTNLTRVPAR